ncbi:MAG TPA: regulatory protein RecX [Bacteroidia bacterium]|nr:regulatory protein RecX [Bacteroidia bacterium]
MAAKTIPLDIKAALAKAQKHCAYQERSQQEMRTKLYEWGLKTEEVENIIVDLINNDFINEERFAIQLASGKFRIKHWGKIKITQALKSHKVSPYCIKKALQQIPDDAYIKSLQLLIEKKSILTKGKITPLKARKLAHYALSKGYESELIWKLIKSDDFFD